MADQSRRIRPAVLDADESSFAALQTIITYAPTNPTYAVSSLQSALDAMRDARVVEAQAEAALAAARDDAVAREWEFHNLLLGVKDQVMAQFGRDSNEVQTLGLKRSSERKAPQRSPTGNAGVK
ncbi:MAG TPA: hypothetical protein VF736_09295 [Pyrinomonadaceae bacterium]|jgi:hypothetical protein